MAVAERMTITEYLELPLRPGVNLIDGEVVVTDPLLGHQHVAGEIFAALRAWAHAERGRGLATLPIDVELDDRNCFAPDVLWYCESRMPHPDVRPQPLPDIAVEVRSPSTWRYDIGAKKARYEQYGLPELWLVDTPANEVLVFRRSTPKAPTFDVSLELARGETLTSPQLPGFAFALAELFG